MTTTESRIPMSRHGKATRALAAVNVAVALVQLGAFATGGEAHHLVLALLGLAVAFVCWRTWLVEDVSAHYHARLMAIIEQVQVLQEHPDNNGADLAGWGRRLVEAQDLLAEFDTLTIERDAALAAARTIPRRRKS